MLLGGGGDFKPVEQVVGPNLHTCTPAANQTRQKRMSSDTTAFVHLSDWSPTVITETALGFKSSTVS